MPQTCTLTRREVLANDLFMGAHYCLDYFNFALLEIRDKELWREKHYHSFAECLRDEFKESRRALWRKVNCAEVLCQLFDLTPEQARSIDHPHYPDFKESVLLEFHRLPDAETKKKALEIAKAHAHEKEYHGPGVKWRNKITTIVAREVVDELLGIKPARKKISPLVVSPKPGYITFNRPGTMPVAAVLAYIKTLPKTD